MAIVPVTVLHGGSVAQRAEQVLAIAGRKDPDARVLHLCNGLDGLPGTRDPQSVARIESRMLPPACPCCAGPVTFRVQVNRFLRELRPAHVVIELPRGWHPTEFVAMLRGPQFSSAIAVESVVDVAGGGLPLLGES